MHIQGMIYFPLDNEMVLRGNVIELMAMIVFLLTKFTGVLEDEFTGVLEDEFTGVLEDVCEDHGLPVLQ